MSLLEICVDGAIGTLHHHHWEDEVEDGYSEHVGNVVPKEESRQMCFIFTRVPQENLNLRAVAWLIQLTGTIQVSLCCQLPTF